MNISLQLSGIGGGDWLVIDGKTVMVKPGDHLLYSPCDLMGRLTGLKTHSPAVHIEIYAGNGKSVASRNGLGVEMYDFRTAQLIAVLEPKQTINMAKALAWFNVPYEKDTDQGQRKRPYGWLDLLRFFNLRFGGRGWICSEFACLFDIEGDFKPFADEYSPGSLSPGDYFTSAALKWKWVEDKARIAVARI